MKRHIDFVIKSDEFEEIKFRFLPKSSHCHSWNENPPASWRQVYKVYYAYKIIYKCPRFAIRYELFNCEWDENSIIRHVATAIKSIIDKDENASDWLDDELRPLGDGVSWIIHEKKDNQFEIIMWRRDGIGFRFELEREKFKAFGEYLNECCEYMLAHGEPI